MKNGAVIKGTVTMTNILCHDRVMIMYIASIVFLLYLQEQEQEYDLLFYSLRITPLYQC